MFISCRLSSYTVDAIYCVTMNMYMVYLSFLFVLLGGRGRRPFQPVHGLSQVTSAF